jgi:hypothetical protein
MPNIPSLFSGGQGKSKELAALGYNATGSLESGAQLEATSGNLLLASGGFRLEQAGQKVVKIAVTGTSSATADDTYLASAGYVDAQIASVSSPTKITFTVVSASAASLVAGKVVAMSDDAGDPALILADADLDGTSNAFGVVSSVPNDTTVIVQVDGEIALSTDLSAFANGALIWVSGTAGAVGTYAALTTGQFATQVGIVSDTAADKVVLQFRAFGEVSA